LELFVKKASLGETGFFVWNILIKKIEAERVCLGGGLAGIYLFFPMRLISGSKG
jgi:hypothetical protein